VARQRSELQNVVEQALWLAEDDSIELEHLPEAVRNRRAMLINHERQRQVADQLFETLVAGHCSFWDHVHRCSSSAILLGTTSGNWSGEV
jgi:transcriptional regulator of acetoin/glycerol metabolism